MEFEVSPPDLGLELAVRALNNNIVGIRLGQGADHWRCKLTGDDMYTISSLRQIIDKHPVNILGTSIIQWSKVVPIKVLSFIWRVVQGRIPAVVALETRGIQVNSLLCSSCIGQPESANHVLIDCPFACMISNNIMRWCVVKLGQISIKNTGDLLHSVATWGSCPKKTKMLAFICYRMLWNLWRFRNKRLFQMESISSLYSLCVMCQKIDSHYLSTSASLTSTTSFITSKIVQGLSYLLEVEGCLNL
ncbi:unnamed protein product [Lactuca virosa]|uniref:Reverse transcriptase zinc-binding domain-containing protein n=1 Tax=Lactuca virosa TaxID=75947 RepID=A0AAU9PUG5_9ASTR|nr:unnamed protein product [Lactuca virosa]